MSFGFEFSMGNKVECADGECGFLTNLVVDPVRKTLTHLVVGPTRAHWEARLVPVELAKPRAGGLQLDCDLAHWRSLPRFEEIEFVPVAPWGKYATGDLLAWPYHLPADAETPLIHHLLPRGALEIRRGEHLHANDGAIGHIGGLVVRPEDSRITHVLLEEGHLWASKEVAIPIADVVSFDADGVHVRLSRRQVSRLSPVEVPEPDRPRG